jgi:uncharacterized membrane protein YdjX (TVP38/TMEM64 family)
MALLKRHARLIGALVFLLSLWAVFHFAGLRGNFNLAFLREQLTQHGAVGLITFVLLFSLGNLIHIPGLLFLGAAVLTLGPLYGGIATYVAACTSCICTFLLVRAVGGDALREVSNARIVRLLARLDLAPVASVAVARIVLQTLPGLNYALALSGIRYRHYLLGTLVGLPLPITLYCVFFEQLSRWMKLG